MRYKRLSMGLCVSSAIFQETMHQVFKGITNIKIAIDDIFVYAKTKKQHDSKMTKVLNTALARNLTLSLHKCQFKKKKFFLI